MNIGIDVGGVILEHNKKVYTGQIDSVRFIDDAIYTIKKLAKKHNLYIVSFCSENTEIQIRKILEGKISIPTERWIFTRTRAEKSTVCNQYQLNVMIDDTFQIHQYLLKDCPQVKRIWFNGDSQQHPHHRHIIASNWKDIEDLLLVSNNCIKLERY